MDGGAVLTEAGRAVKRGIDVVTAAFGCVLLAPLFVAVAIAIRAVMGAPVLFRQRRAGLHGQPFTLVKFRTMRGDPVPGRESLDDSLRLNRVGRFLRRTSFDELPQLWNVFRGDLSLVGPRPLLLEYLSVYSLEQARRHEVKPGITGWAQINGRNALTWQKKLALDVWYVDHASVWLDLKIIIRTAASVLTGHGLTAAYHETMPRFDAISAGDDTLQPRQPR